VKDVSERVRKPVQIATDQLPGYQWHIRQHFGYEEYSYRTETKIFGEPMLADGTLARLSRNEGVRRMQTAERKAVVGSPDLESLTTSHIERVFLSVRQELKRYQRKALGYSKDLDTHKLAVALHFGVYNFVRRHHSLGTTPAVAAGVEQERWTLERVVEMTEAHWQPKLLMLKKEKAWQCRLAEDRCSQTPWLKNRNGNRHQRPRLDFLVFAFLFSILKYSPPCDYGQNHHYRRRARNGGGHCDALPGQRASGFPFQFRVQGC
jgi:hypothetical protein